MLNNKFPYNDFLQFCCKIFTIISIYLFHVFDCNQSIQRFYKVLNSLTSTDGCFINHLIYRIEKYTYLKNIKVILLKYYNRYVTANTTFRPFHELHLPVVLAFLPISSGERFSISG